MENVRTAWTSCWGSTVWSPQKVPLHPALFGRPEILACCSCPSVSSFLSSWWDDTVKLIVCWTIELWGNGTKLTVVYWYLALEWYIYRNSYNSGQWKLFYTVIKLIEITIRIFINSGKITKLLVAQSLKTNLLSDFLTIPKHWSWLPVYVVTAMNLSPEDKFYLK